MGTTINIPYGKYIDVKIFVWHKEHAAHHLMGLQVRQLTSMGPATSLNTCPVVLVRVALMRRGSGLVIRNTIDEAKTGLNFLNSRMHLV